jgi:hypothetical protein
VKRNYGQLAIYPDNATAAKVAALAGKKTLSPRDLALCEDIGFGLAMEGCREDLAEVRDEMRVYAPGVSAIGRQA